MVIFAAEGRSEALKKHLARLPDYLWLAEDGMKMQGYNGSQLWDCAFASQVGARSRGALSEPTPPARCGLQAMVEAISGIGPGSTTGLELPAAAKTPELRLRAEAKRTALLSMFKGERVLSHARGRRSLTRGARALCPGTLQKAYGYIEISQVREDTVNLEKYFRHISNGAWPFSTRDHGWPISDCTAEGCKATLLLHRSGAVDGGDAPSPLAESKGDDGASASPLRLRDGS